MIIPCYNYGHYLPQALQSVLDQSMQEWEAIVIDDASTDNTAEVMHNFTDTRIAYRYHSVNMGYMATLNDGVAQAHGEFVAVLDADDRYLPGFLSRAVAALHKYPEAGMVYTGWEIINARGKPVRRIHSMPHAKDGVYDEFPFLLRHCYIAHCSVLVRKTVYDRIGPHRFERISDWDMWLRISQKYPVAFVSECLYQYRRHGKNFTAQLAKLELTEREIEIVFDDIFRDPTFPQQLKPLRRKAIAWQQWVIARNRFLRGDWMRGVAALRAAIAGDVYLLVHPRRLVGMTLAVLQGLSGRAWSGI